MKMRQVLVRGLVFLSLSTVVSTSVQLLLLPLASAANLPVKQAKAEDKLLTEDEVKVMKLIRLWSIAPVVEKSAVPLPDRSKTVITEIPDQISGANAKVVGVAGRFVCDAKRRGNVTTFAGASYAIAQEPKYPLNTRSDLRTNSTSLQVGRDFSFGGWIKFYVAPVPLELRAHSTAGEIADYNKQIAERARNRAYLRGMTPNYYTFLGKVPSKDLAQQDANLYQRNEWELAMTGEVPYFHIFRSGQSVNFYASRRQAEEWRIFQNCKTRVASAVAPGRQPAIPLKGKLKPVPVPQEPPPSVDDCPRPPVSPPPPIFPPQGDGEQKTHFFEPNTKSSWWAETFSSSYSDTMGPGFPSDEHFESWHFINISVRLSDPMYPEIVYTFARAPMDRSGKLMLAGGWQKHVVSIPLNSEESRAMISRLIPESDAPIQIGNGVFGANAVNNERHIIQRGATYFARSALLTYQVERLARLTFPGGNTTCEKQF